MLQIGHTLFAQQLVTDMHSARQHKIGSKRQIAVPSAFVVFIPFVEWVMTLLQAVAGMMVAWRKKMQAVGWGVRRPPQAGGGARQSLIRQV